MLILIKPILICNNMSFHLPNSQHDIDIKSILKPKVASEYPTGTSERL